MRNFLFTTIAAFLIAFATTAASDARADAAASDSCHCDQYKGLEGFSSLSDEVAAIGLSEEAVTDMPSVSELEARAAALRLRISSNQLIPAECKSRLIRDLERPRVQLFGTLIASRSLPQASPDSAGASGLYSAYSSAYSQLLQNAIATSCPGFQASTSCFFSASNSAWSQLSAALASGQPASVGLTGLSAGDLKILQAYQTTLSNPTEKSALAFARSGAGGLSDAQFLTYVQLLGARMGADYDNARANQVLEAKGVVSGDLLLETAATDTQYGLSAVAGVCRDIMTFQAKMLEARGFPNAYVLSYGLPGAYHTVAIAGDRSNPTKFYTMSYDQVTPTQGLDGSEALFQRGSVGTVAYSDGSLNYIISKPDGNTVAVVPSAMEKFLEEASGFDIRQIDPLARETNTIAGAAATFTSSSGRASATTSLVVGQDGVGAQYSGVAETVRWGEGTRAPGQMGVFVGGQARPGSIFGTPGDETAFLSYLQAQQHVISPAIHLGTGTTLTVDTSATASFMAGAIVQSSSGPSGVTMPNGTWAGPDDQVGIFGGDLRVRSEARVDQVLADGRLHSTYVAGAEVSPGVRDVRDLLNEPSVTLNSVYAGTTQTLNVGAMSLFAQATAAADLLGSRGIAQTGVAGSKWAVSAYVAGRLTGSTPIYEDNTIRRAGVRATYRPNGHLQFGLSGQMPIEGDAPATQAQLMSSAIVTF